MVYEYEYDEDSQTIKINAMYSIYDSSVEDYAVVMAKTIDILRELKKIGRIIFSGTMEVEYDFHECKMLLEIANAIEKIEKDRIISVNNVGYDCEEHIPKRYTFLRKLFSEIRYDPIEAYKMLISEIRKTEIRQKNEPDHARCYRHYLSNALLPIKSILENCEIIKLSKDNLAKHKNRALYRRIFHPTIRPNFMYTRFITIPPSHAELLERYNVGATTIEIYKTPDKTRKIYHAIPPEFKLNEDEYTLLNTARRYIGKHEPLETELAEPEAVRENLFKIGFDMIQDLARNNNIVLNEAKIKELANILTRYSAGLGVLEILLEDENVQDIVINGPIGHAPIFIYHSNYQECETNLIPTKEDAEAWATRFRLLSGRPLDEANPVLDTEIVVPGGRARVAAISRNLAPDGLGFAFRRHRNKPWTFPLFIKNHMINPFSAGLLWFLIDGARTLLIAGTRSSGKTSFLGACMVQIMPHIRIVTTEDTLELPVEALRNLGYNIERLKARSVITRVETELSAEEALRTALRLGDSSLIVGEVRSTEAKALYEAMRIGALANVVAGTIHGENAYGVFDRVVNDLGVPPTSFKATDIIVIANMLRSADGLHSFRRIIEMTEVRKHWKKDPIEEGGFVNLLEYSAKDDKLKPTKTLLTGESVILNNIASRVREWKGNWEAMWNNINLRAKILQTIVNVSSAKNSLDLLEAENVIKSNSQFHIISEDVKREIGFLDSEIIFNRWFEWFKKL